MKDRKLDDCCCYVDLDFTKENGNNREEAAKNDFTR